MIEKGLYGLEKLDTKHSALGERGIEELSLAASEVFEAGTTTVGQAKAYLAEKDSTVLVI